MNWGWVLATWWAVTNVQIVLAMALHCYLSHLSNRIFLLCLKSWKTQTLIRLQANIGLTSKKVLKNEVTFLFHSFLYPSKDVLIAVRAFFRNQVVSLLRGRNRFPMICQVPVLSSSQNDNDNQRRCSFVGRCLQTCLFFVRWPILLLGHTTTNWQLW